jgi:hypothetical protein
MNPDLRAGREIKKRAFARTAPVYYVLYSTYCPPAAASPRLHSQPARCGAATRTGCPRRRGQPCRDMTELRPGNSDRVPSRELLGKHDLPAESLSLCRQRTEVDPACASATPCILPVPRQVVVAGLLVATCERGHQLARDVVESERVSGRWGLYRIAPRSCAAGTIPNGRTTRRVAD